MRNPLPFEFVEEHCEGLLSLTERRGDVPHVTDRDRVLLDFTKPETDDEGRIYLVEQLCENGRALVVPKGLGIVQVSHTKVAALLARLHWGVENADLVFYPRERIGSLPPWDVVTRERLSNRTR